jgi:soluble lytic murein transglycosylase-like protein
MLGGHAQAADGLYYKDVNGTIVFTNVEEKGLKVVPGFAPSRRFVAATPLPASRHDGYIQRLGEELGLSPDLIKAVAMVESGLDPRARSPKGALGLMQLMPATARQYGVDDPFDPRQNLRGGAAHLSDLLDRYDGNLSLALAAYNAGSGAVQRHRGVPPYRETREYVQKVRTLLEGKRAAALPDRVARRQATPVSPVRVVRAADGTIVAAN